VISIDLMRSYFDESSAFYLPPSSCLASATRVLAAARDHGVPVIHTRVVFGPDGVDGGVFIQKIPALRAFIGDTPMNAFEPAAAPLEDELVVVKQYASAFFGTSLSATLRGLGVDTVVLIGVSTSGCIRATAVDAVQHGFVTLVVREAVGDRGPGPHEANLYDLQAKYAEVIHEDQVLHYFESADDHR
jgi:nicotinamidase-related amidase